MNKEELKNKCTERAKIFQQAMESCHSSNPMDCIEWFADRIAELEAQIEKMKCPQNCRYGSISVWCDNSISIDCEKEKFLYEENWCDFCKNCKKWEIKEK